MSYYSKDEYIEIKVKDIIVLIPYKFVREVVRGDFRDAIEDLDIRQSVIEKMKEKEVKLNGRSGSGSEEKN